MIRTIRFVLILTGLMFVGNLSLWAQWTNPGEIHADASKLYENAAICAEDDPVRHFAFFAKDR